MEGEGKGHRDKGKAEKKRGMGQAATTRSRFRFSAPLFPFPFSLQSWMLTVEPIERKFQNHSASPRIRPTQPCVVNPPNWLGGVQ